MLDIAETFVNEPLETLSSLTTAIIIFPRNAMTIDDLVCKGTY